MATDSPGMSGRRLPVAQSFVHSVQAPDYGTVAILTLSNLAQT